MNTTHTTLKNWWYRINLNRRILTYRFFYITYESFFFNRWYRVVLCTVKNLLTYRPLLGGLRKQIRLRLHMEPSQTGRSAAAPGMEPRNSRSREQNGGVRATETWLLPTPSSSAGLWPPLPSRGGAAADTVAAKAGASTTKAEPRAEVGTAEAELKGGGGGRDRRQEVEPARVRRPRQAAGEEAEPARAGRSQQAAGEEAECGRMDEERKEKREEKREKRKEKR
jgi:hypothetical protein